MTATGTYLDGLEPFGSGQRELATTKAGMPFYDWSPHQYEDWKAKVEAAVAGAKLSKEDDRDRELSLVGLHVFQALQGDASRVVRDKLGGKECVVPDGAQKIVDLLEQEIFYRRRDLAKELKGHAALRPLVSQRGRTDVSIHRPQRQVVAPRA